MKQIGLYILLICLLLACQKEDGITPGIGFENLYTIQDDPNDSIQHMVHLINQKQFGSRATLFQKFGILHRYLNIILLFFLMDTSWLYYR